MEWDGEIVAGVSGQREVVLPRITRCVCGESHLEASFAELNDRGSVSVTVWNAKTGPLDDPPIAKSSPPIDR